MAKDVAEKAHKNWKVKGLLGYDKQFGLYYECFEKPLKSFNQGSTVIIYIYTQIYMFIFSANSLTGAKLETDSIGHCCNLLENYHCKIHFLMRS